MNLRKHLHVEAQQGVATHLQQHPCQQHRYGRICFTVGVGQPGVEGEHWQFHPEAHQEAQITEQAKGATGGTAG